MCMLTQTRALSRHSFIATRLAAGLVVFLLALLEHSPAADPDSQLATLRALSEKQRWQEVVAQLKDEDLATWKDAQKQAAEAVSIRARAFSALKDGGNAEKDLKRAIELFPKRGEYWHELGQLYSGLLKNEDLAAEAFLKAFEISGKNIGWVSISSTLNSASLLLDQGQAEQAQRIIERYNPADLAQMAPVWRTKMEAMGAKIADKLSASLHIIADKGASEYQIVLPDTYPTPSIAADMQAVARLVQTAFRAQGVQLPIVAESARNRAQPSIYLGETAFAKSHGIKCSGWTYVHRAVGRDLIIIGKDEPGPHPEKSTMGSGFPRIGSAKAVVDFLHRYVGTRFLFPEQGGFQPLANTSKLDLLNSPTLEFLPTPRIAVPPNLDVKVTPPLDYDISWPPTMSFYHLAQNRFPTIDATFGGHTWHRAVPTDEAAFQANPERFAMLGGKRQLVGSGPSAQLCLSNPDVQRMLYEDVETQFKRGFKTVDLGQPDGFRGCECTPCSNLFGTGADWSEKVWIMHRKLAESAHEKFPDRTVCISVYAVTESLPKTFSSVPPNVQFMLAGTREHEIATWRNFGAPRGFSVYLYYWTPNQMPVFFPMRTPLYVESAAKRLRAANVKSIYRDGNGGIAYGLEGPTYYTMGRMFDGHGDPHAKDLVMEYISAAFGKASPAMFRFYDDLFHSLELYSHFMATREDGWAYTDIYGRKKKHLYHFEPLMAFLYPPELLQALDKHLSLAEKSDPTPKVQMRLALVRSEFNFLRDTVNAVHLYNAYQASNDAGLFDRLLNAIDARRSSIDRMFAKENRLQGWPFTLFPPPGHTAESMKMRRDGYQEPYSESFLNWDTNAKRSAPLPNAKRIVAGVTRATVSLDSKEWTSTEPQRFEDCTVRAITDEQKIHFRFEFESTNAESDRVEAYLAPVPSSAVTFRFSASSKPDSRTQAARGLIDDMMNLEHAKFDPLWKGEWTHTTKKDGKNIVLLMSIPLQSLRLKDFSRDQHWTVNFQRLIGAKTSAWSTLPGSPSIEDRRSYGELSFGVNGHSSQSNTLKTAREKAWKDTFETPPDWKSFLSKATLIPLTNWLFRSDPTGHGVKQQWFKPEAFSESDWQPTQVPSFWGENETVGNYQGEGWYRVRFAVPASTLGKSLKVYFGGVDEQAWIYLNGQQIGEHSTASEQKSFTQLYDAPFTVEIPASHVKPDNTLHVRVHNQAGAGGIWRPVYLVVSDSK